MHESPSPCVCVGGGGGGPGARGIYNHGLVCHAVYFLEADFEVLRTVVDVCSVTYIWRWVLIGQRLCRGLLQKQTNKQKQNTLYQICCIYVWLFAGMASGHSHNVNAKNFAK